MMTRDEHLQWAKDRALEYLKIGDLDNAMASMLMDLSKHPETEATAKAMAPVGLLYAVNRDNEGMRRFIEGFR
jgi:hypothetical protein